MSDLRESLGSAFAAIDPGPAPVDAAMRNGGKIRNRRRAWAIVGSVAAIAIAVSFPALAHQQAQPAPTTSHVRVTVNPPGPHAKAGLIASGTIGAGTWQWLTSTPGTSLDHAEGPCFYAGGTLANQFSMTCGASPSNLKDDGQGLSDPVAFEANGGTDTVEYGTAAPAVSYVTVRLGDGEVLTLHPAMVEGTRYVAFAVPTDMAVGSATAYSSGGEIATAIPYQAADGSAVFQNWLRPGQRVPAEVNGTFGSGTVGGQPWRASAHLGPWGTCLVYGGSSGCFDPSQHPATAAFVGSASWVAGTAAGSVSFLKITFKHGSAIRVGVTTIGGQKFWGVGFSGRSDNGARWTAYDAAGKSIGSGPVF